MIIPHLDASYNLARWLTRSSPDAEDMVQEAYLRAYRYFDTFTGENGRAWILAIVRNTCLTWYSRQKGDSVMFDERTHSFDSAASNPEQESIRMAGIGSLQGCIESIPVEFREVLVMRELEELSYKEIADIASIPIGTVMSRLSRARKLLYACVTDKEGNK
ncbi:MAG: sigma-70 family RNA polymerase sigma factor [Acidobacteriota bacterium]|nr:sigma-70 family RNA polymerase sigma factor [Acidobacteriota bacterium]